jgi:hypothetical protein
MKKFKFIFTNTAQALLLAILVIPFFSTCKDEEKTPPKSSEKKITNLVIKAGEREFNTVLQNDEKTFNFRVPFGFDQNALKSATVTFDLSEGATSRPASGATGVDLSVPKDFIVTAEDGSTFTYTVEKVDEHSPEKAITAFTLKIGGDEVLTGTIDNDASKITFPYPQSAWEQLATAVPTITCSAGATASPASLAPQDFREPVTYTVTADDGSTRTYTAEVERSSEADILAFTITVETEVLTGFVDNENLKILFWVPQAVMDKLGAGVPDITLSPRATVSPASGTPHDFKSPKQYVVTAHNGTTKRTWTVEVTLEPNRGIRPESATLMFAKKLKADLGITVDNMTGGMAVTKDYVILNTRGEKSVYINAKTGEKVGDFDLGEVKGSLRNFYATADGAGNVLICNLAQGDGTFKVWKLTSMTGDTELFIDWPENTADNIGRKISVYGNLNENAIITATILSVPGSSTYLQKFARWKVENGTLKSQTPEIVNISGLAKGWNGNSDIVHTSATNTGSDYFVGAYSENALVWINGATNQVKKKVLTTTTGDAGNYVTNAVDYVEFNNAKYVTTNWVNSFDWGSSDLVWLVDVTKEATFTGSLLEDCPAVVWECDIHTYGPRGSGFAVPEPVNDNATGDVALRVSDDGKYLYLYFMFTNGFVVGYQFDCIGW